MSRRNWQREELLLALNLYCRLPFGQYHNRNPEIIKLAAYLDRTPDAVAMKLSNFASLDPYHQARGIKGLANVSQADIAIWQEFNANWNDLAAESEAVYTALDIQTNALEPTPAELFIGATETIRSTKVRLGQNFFRKVILTSYGRKCCICEMPVSDLLVASHIVRWSDDENLRVNPHNGLCLCGIHDKGFDRGYFTIGEKYEVVISQTLNEYLPNTAISSIFKTYEGLGIHLPDKFIPDQNFLVHHRNHYFLGS